MLDYSHVTCRLNSTAIRWLSELMKVCTVFKKYRFVMLISINYWVFILHEALKRWHGRFQVIWFSLLILWSDFWTCKICDYKGRQRDMLIEESCSQTLTSNSLIVCPHCRMHNTVADIFNCNMAVSYVKTWFIHVKSNISGDLTGTALSTGGTKSKTETP